MAAGIYNITIEQGSTFVLTIIYKDSAGAVVNITGYSARMQARVRKASETPFLDIDSAGGEIVITGASGQLVITVSATVTAAITATYGVYDIEIEDGSGVVTRILEGEVAVSSEVTR